MSETTPPSQYKHPRGLPVLFFSEMWERFSYYGMKALLTLYMTKSLRYSDSRAYEVYGAYTALIYATPVVGGRLADTHLGYRRAIIMGGILMAFGHFFMAIETLWFFFGALALISIGNGFFKANMSSLVGKLYREGDPRRDAGFTIFYMGINTGAFLAPIACGQLGERLGWHYGFTLAGFGMLAGLSWFIVGRARMEGQGETPHPQRLFAAVFPGLNRNRIIMAATLAAVPVGMFLLWSTHTISIPLGLPGIGSTTWQLHPFDIALYTAASFALVSILVIGFKNGREARDRTLLLIVLMFCNVLFWAFFEQTGSSLTLFTERNVNRSLGEWQVQTSLFQSINPFFIVTFGPIFSRIWSTLAFRGRAPSIPMKFSLGLLQMGLGFMCLVWGASRAGADAQTHMMWLVLSYLFQTTGELCESPVGLSAVTKLAPPQYAGTYMGAWFVSWAFANHLSSVIAKFTDVKGEVEGVVISAADQLAGYVTVFRQIAIAAFVAGILLALSSRFLNKLAHGVK